MDRTRRICLTAAGSGVAALMLFKYRGVVTDADSAPGDTVKVVRGADSVPTTGQVVAALSPEAAAWQAEVGRPITLSAAGRRFDGSVAAVTQMARPTPSTMRAASGWWGRFTAGASRDVPPPAAAGAPAALPRGVRPYAFSVLIEVHSQPTPTADMLMDLSRPIEGLRQIFVQPATAIAGKSMVVAWFG